MEPLTLGIDGWRLHGQLTGVGRYISNVLRHWTKEAVADRFGRVTLYTPAPIDRTVIDLPGAIEESVLGPHWRQLLWQNVRLAGAAGDDILFCPSYARPRRSPWEDGRDDLRGDAKALSRALSDAHEAP